jgi:predicted transcriptional regulator/bacterioferritin (cytochrome b1)
MKDIKTQERMIPLVRAWVAKRLAKQGFRVKDISKALGITPAAVSQYVKGRRGRGLKDLDKFGSMLTGLLEKTARMIRSGTGSVEMGELVDVVYQISAASSGQEILESRVRKSEHVESIRLLRERLRLELVAAQRCLELTNRIDDEYSKMLLRMIASDSLRHADVVSQIISWLETGRATKFQPPDLSFLKGMLEIEDKASESSLKEKIEIPHPVAKVLLDSIDMDEEKHERILSQLLELLNRGSKTKA